MCCGRQAEKLGATGFERINRNGLATEKAQNQLLIVAIPEQALGVPITLLLRSRFSVAVRFS
jgi:hypothetical protein